MIIFTIFLISWRNNSSVLAVVIPILCHEWKQGFLTSSTMQSSHGASDCPVLFCVETTETSKKYHACLSYGDTVCLSQALLPKLKILFRSLLHWKAPLSEYVSGLLSCAVFGIFLKADCFQYKCSFQSTYCPALGILTHTKWQHLFVLVTGCQFTETIPHVNSF